MTLDWPMTSQDEMACAFPLNSGELFAFACDADALAYRVAQSGFAARYANAVAVPRKADDAFRVETQSSRHRCRGRPDEETAFPVRAYTKGCNPRSC
jgi:hypothetical protein